MADEIPGQLVPSISKWASSSSWLLSGLIPQCGVQAGPGDGLWPQKGKGHLAIAPMNVLAGPWRALAQALYPWQALVAEDLSCLPGHSGLEWWVKVPGIRDDVFVLKDSHGEGGIRTPIICSPHIWWKDGDPPLTAASGRGRHSSRSRRDVWAFHHPSIPDCTDPNSLPDIPPVSSSAWHKE